MAYGGFMMDAAAELGRNPVSESLLARVPGRLNLVLTYGIPPEFRGGVHL